MILAAILASFLVLATLGRLHRVAELRDRGEVERTQVQAKYEDVSSRRSRDYVLEVELAGDPSGKMRAISVSRQEYERARVGDSVVITYLLSDPSVHRLGRVGAAAAQAEAKSTWAAVLLVVAVLGAALGWMELSLRRQLHLARVGEAVPGEILRLGSRGRNGTYLEYRYQGPGGEMVTGRGWAPIRRSPPVQAGETVTVLYDPASPGRNAVLSALNAIEINDGTSQELAGGDA